MGFSRQEYWNGLPCSSPRDLPNPGIEPGSPVLQLDPLLSGLSHQGSTMPCILSVHLVIIVVIITSFCVYLTGVLVGGDPKL